MVIFFLLGLLLVLMSVNRTTPVTQEGSPSEAPTPRLEMVPTPNTYMGPRSQKEKIEVKIPRAMYDDFLVWQDNNRQLFG
jgi:hypothetical protein